MTSPCPCCGHSPSRLPFAVAVLTVLVIASIGLGVFNLWRDNQIEDRISRISQAHHTVIDARGNYHAWRVYRDGAFDQEEGKEPVKKENGRKK